MAVLARFRISCSLPEIWMARKGFSAARGLCSRKRGPAGLGLALADRLLASSSPLALQRSNGEKLPCRLLMVGSASFQGTFMAVLCAAERGVRKGPTFSDSMQFCQMALQTIGEGHTHTQTQTKTQTSRKKDTHTHTYTHSPVQGSSAPGEVQLHVRRHAPSVQVYSRASLQQTAPFR